MFHSEAELEDHLTTPSSGLIDDFRATSGDVLVLGAGGKMGPTLCRLARRAMDAAGRHADKVIAVSRWTDHAAARRLSDCGVTVHSFDLLGDTDYRELPDAAAVVFMVGAKFGTAQTPSLAWMINAVLPARVAARYTSVPLVALSTGNVYPFVPATSGGSVETDPTGPTGEYAMSCLGRERVLQHAALSRGTPIGLIRLNYAIDLRYGVLADVGSAVLAGQPVDTSTDVVNVVWQGYANDVVLRSLRCASPDVFLLNLTGPETASVRKIATQFGAHFQREPVFAGEPAPTALLSDATRCHGLFGYPPVPLGTLVDWQAAWLQAGLPTSGKATKFSVRDGRF